MYIFPKIEEDKNNIEKSECINIKEIKEKLDNNIIKNVSINNYVRKGSEKINGGINNIEEI